MFFLEVYLFYSVSIGKYFWNDGKKYEGEYKDGKEHGKGMK